MIVQALGQHQADRDRGAADAKQREAEPGAAARRAQPRGAAQRQGDERDHREDDGCVARALHRADALGHARAEVPRHQHGGEGTERGMDRVGDRRLDGLDGEEIAGPGERGGEVHRQHEPAVAPDAAQLAGHAPERERQKQHGREREDAGHDEEEAVGLERVGEPDVAHGLREREGRDEKGAGEILHGAFMPGLRGRRHPKTMGAAPNTEA